MDVTRRADIDRTVDTIIREAGRIDAVVHFAGMGLRGFFEDLSMQEIRRLYDVNVFGIMELTQAVLPHMRERRSGRIVITASAAGRMGEMSIAGYSSGKFAVVGLGECLRQEVALFNMQVSVLEPGLIYTPHFGVNRNRARRAQDPASPYYFWFCQHEAIVDKSACHEQIHGRRYRRGGSQNPDRAPSPPALHGGIQAQADGGRCATSFPSNGSSAFTKKSSSAWWPVRPSGHRPQRPGCRHRRAGQVPPCRGKSLKSP